MNWLVHYIGRDCRMKSGKMGMEREEVEEQRDSWQITLEIRYDLTKDARTHHGEDPLTGRKTDNDDDDYTLLSNTHMKH